MARNAEKAMTTLARWRQAYVDKVPERERRPHLATECDDLVQAERWHTQVVREVARKVSQIQNAGLGEFRIRDLNDEINKLLREKRHWEARIKQLGGQDYARTGPRMLDREGREVPGNRGYRYFGAARDLPGVRELFEQEPPAPPRKSRVEMMRDVDADYYGYMDDDDGRLVPLERRAEKRAERRAVARWKAAKQQKDAKQQSENSDISRMDTDTQSDGEDQRKEGEDEEDVSEEDDDGDSVCSDVIVAHVSVPTQKEIEAALVEHKKRELLARFVSDCPPDDEAVKEEVPDTPTSQEIEN